MIIIIIIVTKKNLMEISFFPNHMRFQLKTYDKQHEMNLR